MSSASEGAPARAGSPSEAGDLDPRTLPIYELYRSFRTLMLADDQGGGPSSVARHLLRQIAGESTSPRSVVAGGRIYRRVGDSFELTEKVGEAGPVPIGYRIPAGYPILQEALREGWVLAQRSDPRFDLAIEEPVGADAFAIMALGPQRDLLVAFTLRQPVAERELAYALATLRSMAETAVRHGELRSFVEEARRIQTSLLPDALEVPEGYEAAARSRPAELVGGDVYDLHPLLPETFGLSIADATGHGLPAALQARDVIVGLRMGVEQRLKMVATVEKLDRVIARSTTSGRFISLFHAELDDQGHVIYVNAGHVPPLILGPDRHCPASLATGGPVLGLGLAPGKRHRRGFERLAPGELLVLYTDGLTELRSPQGAELGAEGLVRVLRGLEGRPLPEAVDAVFAEADRFTAGLPQPDDQTLVLVRRVD